MPRVPSPPVPRIHHDLFLEGLEPDALNLRFRNATGQLDNSSEIQRVKRQIARINTLIRQREIAAAEAGSK